MANEVPQSQRMKLMQYLIVRPQGNFQDDIARDLDLRQGDITDALGSLEKSGYIQHPSAIPVLAIRKTVYWKINYNTLYDLFVDPEFKDLQIRIQQQDWIIQTILKIFPGFSERMLSIISKMLRSSPSFFEYIIRHDTFDKFKEYYLPYFQINQFLTGFDSSFVDYWVIYQVLAECCIKDNLVHNEILDEMLQELIKETSPASRQREDIRHLQQVVNSIELTFPYWGKEYRSIKESLLRDISEFKVRCGEANLLSPEPDPAKYTAVFDNILHNLVMNQYGDTSDM